MPYIESYVRKYFETAGLDNLETGSPGELNYCITRLLVMYMKNNGESYKTINDCVGALECAKLELYRRVAAPYEDLKIQDNGDVYDT